VALTGEAERLLELAQEKVNVPKAKTRTTEIKNLFPITYLNQTTAVYGCSSHFTFTGKSQDTLVYAPKSVAWDE